MPRLIVFAGLPGTGKSTIARALAARTGAAWLRIDTMDQAIWSSGTAPEDLRDWTCLAAQAVAADNLALGHDEIADCVNDGREPRDGWQKVARRAGVEIIWLEIVCSDPAEHRRRVEMRTSDIAGLVLPDWTAVETRAYEPWDRDHVTIDTAHRAIGDAIAAAVAAIES